MRLLRSTVEAAFGRGIRSRTALTRLCENECEPRHRVRLLLLFSAANPPIAEANRQTGSSTAAQCYPAFSPKVLRFRSGAKLCRCAD